MSGAQHSPRTDRQSENSQAEATYHETSLVSTSISHPWLLRADSTSISTSLGLPDQYRTQIKARALQLAVVDVTTTEPVVPVNLTYGVHPEWLESIVELQLVPDLSDPETIMDSTLRMF